ncbi:MAG: putative helix-turn-helix protein YlxM/p13 family protein [Anaerocolumna sp.]|jgi:predicted DNA-binding protein YlxM (UPF0122 family)|nr:putative helix-turn-helix protein YlxM/p13 family protein [Anaerocolumna sp.]
MRKFDDTVINDVQMKKEDRITDDKLIEKVELSILFDFYGELLKTHNRHIFEDYILNDLSLSEIADEQGISRQGVHDIVKRCSKQLKDYEDTLKLIKKFDLTKTKINRIKELSETLYKNSTLYADELNEIIQLSDNILQDL